LSWAVKGGMSIRHTAILDSGLSRNSAQQKAQLIQITQFLQNNATGGNNCND